MQARSRLKSAVGQVTPTFSSSVSSNPRPIKPPARSWATLHLQLTPQYLRRLPTLIFGSVWYVGVWYMMTNVAPEQIQNWPLPNFYAPFQLALFLGTWLVVSYLFLNSRRGFVIAAAVQIVVFLRLQQVLLTAQLVLGLLIFFAIIELLGTWLERRELPPETHANFQKTFHRRRRPPTRTVLQRFG